MGGLFATPKAPAVPEPTPIPDQDDEAIRRARRRSLSAARNRSGVLSTIRPSAGGALGAAAPGGATVLGGAQNYSGKTMGGR